MQKQIEELFTKNSQLIGDIGKGILYFRKQNYVDGNRKMQIVLSDLSVFIKDMLINIDYFNENLENIQPNTVVEMLSLLLAAQQTQDYILLADLYELQILPFLVKLQEIILMKEDYHFDETIYIKNIAFLEERDPILAHKIQKLPDAMDLQKEGYTIEYASCGKLTIAVETETGRIYLHSNYNVDTEAFLLANAWYSKEKYNYHIFGMGLLYHIRELSAMSEYTTIVVYEPDLNLMKIALSLCPMDDLLQNCRISFCIDSDGSKLLDQISHIGSEDATFFYYPSIRTIKNKTCRETIEDFYVRDRAFHHQEHILDGNFKANQLLFDEPVDALQSNMKGKDLYIVAGGPSLDKNIKLLHNLDENAIILSTGTVLHKLVTTENILPDYCIMIAGEDIYGQVKGLEDIGIPLLGLSTLYRKVFENYHGKKYMICQKGYEKAEKFAKEKGYMLFGTGGSVSTTALDIGIQFQCRRIIFLGLDLAYTENKTHASATIDEKTMKEATALQVLDWDGNYISTPRNLNMYRKWIENRIKSVKGIEFIDATEGGARIDGMKRKTLAQVLMERNMTR